MQRILASLPRDDLTDLSEDGKLVMTCEFCSRDFSADLGNTDADDDIRIAVSADPPPSDQGQDKGRLH